MRRCSTAALFANGNVIIVNGAGIHFGPNAHVDVGSLIASTAGISNSNFLGDRMIFDRPGLPDAMVSNEGMITVRDTGLAALVAPGVENSGLIRANLGTVILGAGEAHTIDFSGDGLVAFTITEPTKTAPKRRDGSTAEALVSNSGTVEADGGSIVMTASQASRVLDNAINMSGVAQANSVGMRNGKIVLFGGDKGRVKVGGRVRANGARKGETGGTVHITGEEIPIPKSRIEALGEAGGGEVLIGGALKGGKLDDGSAIGYLQDGDLVSILTGENAGAAGNGYIPEAEAVYIGEDTVVDVSATGTGNGGMAIVWANGTTIFNGAIRARGGDLAGDGGFVETSGAGRLGVGATASVDALAPNGKVGDWLLDPLSVTVETGGLASLGDIGDTGDRTRTLVVDPGVINDATANVTIFAVETITFNDAVSIAAYGVGLTATAEGRIIVNDDITTNNGDIFFDAPTVILDGNLTITSIGEGEIVPDMPMIDFEEGPTAEISGTAMTVNVLSNAAEIQDGVDVAADGATVNVGDGTFAGGIVIDKPLTLIGDGFTNTTIVDVADNDVGKTITSSGVTIDGFLFRGDGDPVNATGVLVDGSGGPLDNILIGDANSDSQGNRFTGLTTGLRIDNSGNRLNIVTVEIGRGNVFDTSTVGIVTDGHCPRRDQYPSEERHLQ